MLGCSIILLNCTKINIVTNWFFALFILCLVTLETEKLEMVGQDSGDQPTTLIKNEQQQQQSVQQWRIWIKTKLCCFLLIISFIIITYIYINDNVRFV